MFFRKNSYNVNSFWLAQVLLYFATAIVTTMMASIPLGSVIFWAFLVYLGHMMLQGNLAYLDKKPNPLLVTGLTTSIGVFLLTIPQGYQVSLMQKLCYLLFLWYICYCEDKNIGRMANLKPVTVKGIAWVMVLFVLVLVIGNYINAVSMLFVPNYVKTKLSMEADFKIAGFVVLALVPAISEEMIFRGYILGHMGKRKKGIIISSLLFALLHMNINQISYAFTIGLILSAVAVYMDNVSYSILIHLLVNTFTLLTTWFKETAYIQKILSLQIFGYYPLAPFLKDGQGLLLTNQVLIGFVCTLVAAGLCFLIFRRLGSTFVKEDKMAEERSWKPNGQFLVACLICLLHTIVYELQNVL